MRGANQSSISELLLQGPSSQQPHCLLPDYAPGCGPGKSAYPPGHKDGLLPAHSHVLLPQKSVLSGHLLLLQYHPQEAGLSYTQSQSIFSGCLTQMYLLFELANMGYFLLAVMAYDCFVTICHSLHYSAKMIQQLCALLVTGIWVITSLNTLLHTLLMV